MNMDNISNSKQYAKDGTVSSPDEKRFTDSFRIPFLIRAWWLREFDESKEFPWYQDTVAPALWSSYSDPMCDLGAIDDVEDL